MLWHATTMFNTATTIFLNDNRDNRDNSLNCWCKQKPHKKNCLYCLYCLKKVAVIIKKFVLESYSCSKKTAVAVKKNADSEENKTAAKKDKNSKKKGQKRFAYLCIFALVFSDVLKEPNLRFESAFLTSSKRLFDELIKAL